MKTLVNLTPRGSSAGLRSIADALQQLEKSAREMPHLVTDEAALHPAVPLEQVPRREVEHVLEALDRAFSAVRDRDERQQLLVATAAHDLRTPLSVVASAAWALKDENCTPEDAAYWVDCLLRNVVTLQTLVEDFNDGVRARAGRLELRRELLDLAELARETVEDFALVADRNPLHFDGEPVWVRGDRERLKRLLFNLLSNAAKYSAAGGRIQVDVWRRGRHACLFVRDEGRGLAPAEAERMFQPFTRLRGTQEMGEGDGLGLASVKRIADAHGAVISVQGVPGKGASFEVRFTAVENPGAARPAPAAEHTRGGRV